MVLKKLEKYESGKYVKINDYKAFIPSKINYDWGWDDTKLNKLLAEANIQIGELNAYSSLIPNIDLSRPINFFLGLSSLGSNKLKLSFVSSLNI